jgi:tetratricopeptide (TPR) repeat protein
LVVLLGATILCTGVRAADKEKTFAVALPDDTETRGDWIGTYGTHAYLLGGMRGRRALHGGEPVDWSYATGDPEEKARGWQSSMPTRRNRSILLEPNGWKRTGACLDDHGEVRPLGEGPDLHLGLSVPDGPFLVSLYFFEVDWIQYRDYQIRVLEAETDRELLQMHAADFLKGIYKRFAVYGPVELRIVIERGLSPNAQTSGIFVDRLSYPSTDTLPAAEEFLPAPASTDDEEPHDLKSATAAARQALARLRAQPGDPDVARDYILAERRFSRAVGYLCDSNPRRYYREFAVLWSDARQRTRAAVQILPEDPMQFYVRLIDYCAAREGCNYPAARSRIRAIGERLAARSIDFGAGAQVQQEFLEKLLTARLQKGRRNEAMPLAEAYVGAVLQYEKPTLARMNLVRMATEAMRSRVTTPFARGLERWKEENGALSVDDRLLLATLYYVAGEHAKANEYYQKAEPDLVLDRKRKWAYLARMTALLRMGREQEAKRVAAKLKKTYPASPELDEAKYRFCVHYYKTGDLGKAKKAFERLMETTRSVGYKKLCRQYLDRIKHKQEMQSKQGG